MKPFLLEKKINIKHMTAECFFLSLKRQTIFAGIKGIIKT